MDFSINTKPTQVTEKVMRVSVAGPSSQISFGSLAVKQFLVKNFTSEAIFVSFSPLLSGNIGIKIPANTAQLVFANLADAANNEGTSSLYVKGTGEVEVQAVLY